MFFVVAKKLKLGLKPTGEAGMPGPVKQLVNLVK